MRALIRPRNYPSNGSHFRYYFVIASVAKQSHEIATGPLTLRDDDFLSEI